MPPETRNALLPTSCSGEKESRSVSLFDHSAERAALSRLLARLWEREVDAEWLAELCRGELASLFGPAALQQSAALPKSEALQQLQTDYCRLFVGPQEHFPPVQSVWQEGRFEGAPVPSVKRFFSVVPSFVPQKRLPADHAGQLFRFYAELLESAQAVSDAEDRREVEELLGAFFDEHLRWLIAFCRQTISRAETPFYRNVLQMTDDYLQQEAILCRETAERGTPSAGEQPDKQKRGRG